MWIFATICLLWCVFSSVLVGADPPEGMVLIEAGEFLMVSLWESVDALRAIGGEHWDKAQLNVEELDLVEQVHIRHYEALSQA